MRLATHHPAAVRSWRERSRTNWGWLTVPVPHQVVLQEQVQVLGRAMRDLVDGLPTSPIRASREHGLLPSTFSSLGDSRRRGEAMRQRPPRRVGLETEESLDCSSAFS